MAHRQINGSKKKVAGKKAGPNLTSKTKSLVTTTGSPGAARNAVVDMDKRTWTAAEVALYLGVTPTHVRRLAREPKSDFPVPVVVGLARTRPKRWERVEVVAWWDVRKEAALADRQRAS